MFQISDEPESPSEGGVFKIYDEPESPNEGACLRYMTDRNRHMRGAFKMYDELECPYERACLRYITNQNRQMRGRVQLCKLSSRNFVLSRRKPTTVASPLHSAG